MMASSAPYINLRCLLACPNYKPVSKKNKCFVYVGRVVLLTKGTQLGVALSSQRGVTSSKLTHLTTRVKPWVKQSSIIFDSMERTLKLLSSTGVRFIFQF